MADLLIEAALRAENLEIALWGGGLVEFRAQVTETRPKACPVIVPANFWLFSCGIVVQNYGARLQGTGRETGSGHATATGHFAGHVTGHATGHVTGHVALWSWLVAGAWSPSDPPER